MSHSFIKYVTMKMFVARIADGHRVRPGYGKPGEILTISFRGLRENHVLSVIRKSWKMITKICTCIGTQVQSKTNFKPNLCSLNRLHLV